MDIDIFSYYNIWRKVNLPYCMFINNSVRCLSRKFVSYTIFSTLYACMLPVNNDFI